MEENQQPSPTTLLSKIHPTDWESHWKVQKQDLNTLILNYFIYEGLYDLAHTFSLEKDLPFPPNKFLIIRHNLRTLFLDGRIDDAINTLNEIDSNILDSDTFIYYFLNEHKAFEMIEREDDIETVIEFIENEIVPIVEREKMLLCYLEDLMENFVFRNIKIDEKRQEIANYVNKKLMQERDEECMLKTWVREVVEGEKNLDEKYVFPKFEKYFE